MSDSSADRLAALAPQTGAEFAPLLRRAVGLDPACLARLRIGADAVRLLIRLPFNVLVGRSLEAAAPGGTLGHRPTVDVTLNAGQLLDWIDGTRPDAPPSRDADWRGAAPPDSGWHRIETVPDAVVRDLVRTGALTLKQAAEREALPGAQPRAEVADVLLDSIVLTASDETTGARAEVSLRALSALTRMGFLPRGSHVAVDIAGGWTRLAAAYGSVFAEPAGAAGLGLLRA